MREGSFHAPLTPLVQTAAITARLAQMERQLAALPAAPNTEPAATLAGIEADLRARGVQTTPAPTAEAVVEPDARAGLSQ